MVVSPRGHVQTHIRFYVSALIGGFLWLAMGRLAPALRMVAAGDGFFAAYLVSVAWLIVRCPTPDHLRRRASSDDEGIAIIIVITLVAIVLSFYSIFSILNQEQPSVIHLLLALIGVPLGWLAFHAVMAFHYAHLYYGQLTAGAGKHRDAGGLAFPGDQPPGFVDFLYYSFVIAMTAQVSDVQVVTTEMRQVTLVHGVASFFFNTVILALAVNVAAGLTH
jgi:uncharacterized membrane protein